MRASAETSENEQMVKVPSSPFQAVVGRLVAEPLERQRAALQERPPPVIGQLGLAQPFAPERGGGGQLRERLLVARRRVRMPGQRREGVLALVQDGVPVAARAGHRQAKIG
jgi:hypothetical protein